MNKKIETWFNDGIKNLTIKELKVFQCVLEKEIKRRTIAAFNAPNVNQFEFFSNSEIELSQTK